MTRFTVVIPARYASTRLPGKPLLEIAGKPMIQHVYERARLSQAVRVVIATDSEAVCKAARGFGAEICMTAHSHESGTDRLQEAATVLGLDPDTIVVNVQGDEPLIPPEVIDQVAENLARCPQAGIATLCEPIDDPEQLFDPNVVKVVTDERGWALYFSRAPIPWPRDALPDFTATRRLATLPAAPVFYRHVGIYGYRVQLLCDFVRWPMGRLEQVERLEQLRAMEQGCRIHVAASVRPIPPGVDTQQDLARIQALFD